MLSLAAPPANHSSGTQGAFRLYPTPKHGTERQRGMLLEWGRASSQLYSLVFPLNIEQWINYRLSLQQTECWCCVTKRAAPPLTTSGCSKRRASKPAWEASDGQGIQKSQVIGMGSGGCEVRCLPHTEFWESVSWTLEPCQQLIGGTEDLSKTTTWKRVQLKDTGWS